MMQDTVVTADVLIRNAKFDLLDRFRREKRKEITIGKESSSGNVGRGGFLRRGMAFKAAGI